MTHSTLRTVPLGTYVLCSHFIPVPSCIRHVNYICMITFPRRRFWICSGRVALYILSWLKSKRKRGLAWRPFHYVLVNGVLLPLFHRSGACNLLDVWQLSSKVRKSDHDNAEEMGTCIDDIWSSRRSRAWGYRPIPYTYLLDDSRISLRSLDGSMIPQGGLYLVPGSI